MSNGAPKSLRGPVLATLAVGAALAAVAWALSGVSAARSVFLGATVAAANLLWWRALVRAALAGQGGVLAAFAPMKLAGTIAALYFLVAVGLASPLALAIGYAALPAGLVVAELARRDRGDPES